MVATRQTREEADRSQEVCMLTPYLLLQLMPLRFGKTEGMQMVRGHE